MYTPQEIEKYYDEWTARYLDVYGDIIQAFRPTDHRLLLDTTAENAGINSKGRILDAGSGVCGPAIYFAEKYKAHISCVTVSGVQAAIATKRVNARLLQNQINIVKGDYHHLPEYFAPATFRLVLFLESLGHSHNVTAVAAGVAKVIQPGGAVYIKDFFKRKVDNAEEQKKIDFVIANMNKNYAYNTLALDTTLEAFKAQGFIVEFIKPLGFVDDIAIRKKFEDKFGIDNFEGLKEFAPAEWLGIKLIKQ